MIKSEIKKSRTSELKWPWTNLAEPTSSGKYKLPSGDHEHPDTTEDTVYP